MEKLTRQSLLLRAGLAAAGVIVCLYVGSAEATTVTVSSVKLLKEPAS